MKTSIFIFAFTGLIIVSCTNINSNKSNVNNIAFNKDNEEGLKLLQQNCYACHSISSKSHEEIIAPPMAAVKRRYLMSYATKDVFIEAFTNWVLNPTEENALMKGAVANFKVMPKQNFNSEDIKKISAYIFENDIEKPIWFENHFNNEHSKGMGGRLGRGRNNNTFNSN